MTGCWNSPPPKPGGPIRLMGWTGSGDTQAQVQLKFPSVAAAQAYATRYGIDAAVHAVPPRRLKLQTYADNFMA